MPGAEDHRQELHSAAQRPDEKHQHRPADDHFLRARAGNERIFQEVAERKLPCRRRGRVAGAVHIVGEHQQHEHRRHRDDDDRKEPAELHRRLHQLAEIGVESLDAVLLPALSRVGEDGLARAGLLIGVDQKIGEHEERDGDKAA